MKRKITNPKPYLSHQPLFGGLLILYFVFLFFFWTYKHAVYQRFKGPVWNISADLLAATARLVFSAVRHALVISIYIYIKSGCASDEAAKWLPAPAAAEKVNVFIAARRGKSIGRDIRVGAPPAIGCHQMFHPGPQTFHLLHRMLTRAKWAKASQRLRKTNPSPVCVHVTISIKVLE